MKEDISATVREVQEGLVAKTNDTKVASGLQVGETFKLQPSTYTDAAGKERHAHYDPRKGTYHEMDMMGIWHQVHPAPEKVLPLPSKPQRDAYGEFYSFEGHAP